MNINYVDIDYFQEGKRLIAPAKALLSQLA
jgi:hypothetical protein